MRSEDDVLTFIPEVGFAGSDMVTLHMVFSWGDEAAQEITLKWEDAQLNMVFLPMVTEHRP
jgi:hypothetical protein